MEGLFSRLVEENTPKVNPEVMNGLACTYMQKAEEYVNKIFKSASKSFPNGLVYNGYERCTPQEEFNVTTKVRYNKRSTDLARSDLYLVKFKFSYFDEALPDHYLYLPYVNDAGTFSLGGAMFHVTPVLSDKVISPGIDNVFVRLLRDKIIFKRCYHTIVINNKRETIHVPWSQIYRKSKNDSKIPITTKANTIIVHYLFAKYGFTETFNKFAGVIPVIGEEEINEKTYPATDWVICSSSQVKPKTYIYESYNPSNLRITIPKDKWNNITKSLVVGFFYIIDHFPDRFRIPSYVDNNHLWMILLGHIIFSGNYGENKLYNSIKDHFVSLDDYVDNIIIDKLKESNYYVNDFYDLLVVILDNFNNLILDNDNTASLYGKNLEVLYYMLYEVTSGIFRINFKLSKQTNRRPLTKKDITEAFNKNLKMGAVFGLSSGKIIAESVSYSGDHKYLKLTSKIVEQENLPGGARGKSRRTTVDDTKHIDISAVEAGSVLFMSKSNPAPSSRINMFITLDKNNGTILPNIKFNNLRIETQRLLKGKRNVSR